MGFKIKTFTEILNDMATFIMSTSSKITNFFIGSVIRTLLEAIASEIEELYFEMYRGFKLAVQNSIFHSFDFYKLPAVASTGYVTLSFKSPLPPEGLMVLKGYKFSTSPQEGEVVYFEVVEETWCPPYSISADILVKCTETGLVGNVSANAIKILVNPIDFVSQVHNTDNFVTGLPEETEENRKQRFTMFIETLGRGTNNALQYGCLRVEGVTGVYIDESIGMVKAYVHDASGSLPSDLKQRVIDSVNEYRCAGIQVTVAPVVKRQIDLVVTISLQTGFDYEKYCLLVQEMVTTFLNNFTVSKNLTKAELIKYIMNIDESAILNVSLNISEDIEVAKFELIRPGLITVV